MYRVWPTIAERDCNGTRQSPKDIVTVNILPDANLNSFKFTGYDDETTLYEIENLGYTIQIALDQEKMKVQGGDLPGLLISTQIHFHWGKGSAMPGSEHAVDGKRYPMEIHIVNKAVDVPNLLAALGFFIEATNDTGKPKSWKILTSYLAEIANAGDKVCITKYISMDDLLPGVDRTKYYRYFGSLTTPNCIEGVVLTIFKDPIKVSRDLIDLFSTTVHVNKASSSPLMTNTFRGIQAINRRIVKSQVTGSILSSETNPCFCSCIYFNI
ncbi:carbonic anhydrase 4-like [Triplophysa dalaica]|uniref:carbonic anhydrase 4-like n=1 Tax=Triplophysa dalaica TaxID=1582913 RepID=UPI0024E01F70|nr:carbonic anhydrase 4-like [Triplophysa dalaica]